MPRRAQDRPCIVIDKPSGDALGIGHYEERPRAGVLVRGAAATLFRNRRRALRAIQRSTRYAEANDLPWRTEDYVIVNVDLEPSSRG